MNAPDRELSKSIQLYHTQFAAAASEGKSIHINCDNTPLLVQTFTAMLRKAQMLEDENFQFKAMLLEAQEKALAEGQFNAPEGETVQ